MCAIDQYDLNVMWRAVNELQMKLRHDPQLHDLIRNIYPEDSTLWRSLCTVDHSEKNKKVSPGLYLLVGEMGLVQVIN